MYSRNISHLRSISWNGIDINPFMHIVLVQQQITTVQKKWKNKAKTNRKQTTELKFIHERVKKKNSSVKVNFRVPELDILIPNRDQLRIARLLGLELGIKPVTVWIWCSARPNVSERKCLIFLSYTLHFLGIAIYIRGAQSAARKSRLYGPRTIASWKINTFYTKI